MPKFIIRNDDVAFDTDVESFKKFCEICDSYGYTIIQAITPIGECKKVNSKMTNDEIRRASFRRFEENTKLYDFLKMRVDSIAVHGLWHTHIPTEEEIESAKQILSELGLSPTYFVPPFNEGDYPEEICGLTNCQLSMKNNERLEDFLDDGEPSAPIMYLHSNRFEGKPYTLDMLDRCLARISIDIKKISNMPADPLRLWYNDWVKQNARGKVLDIGKSRHWDYGFPTLDNNPDMQPTFTGSIEQINFPDETFDTVLCNGLYELVENPKQMIDEAIRITKKGGVVILGFVGKGYKPYLKNWKYYSEKETIPPHERKDFGDEYHYIIVKKQ